jgi:asparagine synthase (glutamine-hydrolysing)
LGAFLSGGVDSSLVVSMMAREMSSPVKTFSIGFDDNNFSELKYARIVSKALGTEHYEEVIKPDCDSIITNLIDQFDEPFADSSAIPTYYVSKMTRKFVTVSLSGDGGDEIFGGYDRYRESNVTKLSKLLPNIIKKSILNVLINNANFYYPGKNTINYVALSEDQQIVRKYCGPLITFLSEIFTQEFFRSINSSDPSNNFNIHLHKMRGHERIEKLQYLDVKTYLPCDILQKVDRMSMLVSLEARVPMLDHKLIEFSATIPNNFKIRNGETKYLLKKIAEKYIPKDVIYRPKRGFAIPLSKWIKKEWKDMTIELLLSKKSQERRIFNQLFIEKIVKEHMSGNRDHGGSIWTLMLLELWLRKYF